MDIFFINNGQYLHCATLQWYNIYIYIYIFILNNIFFGRKHAHNDNWYNVASLCDAQSS